MRPAQECVEGRIEQANRARGGVLPMRQSESRGDVQAAAPSSRSRVYQHLLKSGVGKTKRELSEELGLSLPTVYQALTSLAASGLIFERADRDSTGGRPATSFYVDPMGVLGVGVSVTGTSLRTVVCGLNGDTIVETEAPCRVRGDLPELVHRVARAADEAIGACGERASQVVGAGIAIPAIIRPGSCEVVNARALGLEPFDGAEITSAVACGARLFNDASCGGYAEVFDALGEQPEQHDRMVGAAGGGHNAVFLSLESGVGGAVLVGAKPFEGMNGRSGEFGHICVEPDGRECSCGQRGCLQAYCSADCLSGDLGLTLDEFFEALGAGNERACEVWGDFANHLARGIAALRLSLDVDVILGGLLAPYLATRLDDIRERVAVLCPFDDDASFVRLARHQRYGVPIGAARRVVDAYAATL